MYISDVQEDDLEIAIKVSGDIQWALGFSDNLARCFTMMNTVYVQGGKVFFGHS